MDYHSDVPFLTETAPVPSVLSSIPLPALRPSRVVTLARTHPYVSIPVLVAAGAYTAYKAYRFLAPRIVGAADQARAWLHAATAPRHPMNLGAFPLRRLNGAEAPKSPVPPLPTDAAHSA